MTNALKVAEALSTREGPGGLCSGRRQRRDGTRTRNAQFYPRGLCRATLDGADDQLRDDGLLRSSWFGIQVPDEDEELLRNMYSPERGYGGRYREDLIGQSLCDDLVQAARATELAFSTSNGVEKGATITS